MGFSLVVIVDLVVIAIVVGGPGYRGLQEDGRTSSFFLGGGGGGELSQYPTNVLNHLWLSFHYKVSVPVVEHFCPTKHHKEFALEKNERTCAGL